MYRRVNSLVRDLVFVLSPPRRGEIVSLAVMYK